MEINQLTRIGFIGLGIMGKSMAGHLGNAGYRLNLHNRSRGGASELEARGAQWYASPGELAANSDVVITMVGLPRDVEQVYLGPDGIIANARAGTLMIDMSTSEPALAQRIAALAADRLCQALDAPVSGGDGGARAATLAIMVGGAQASFDAALPILRTMGSNIVRQGEAGAGQHTKMCNQVVIASTIMGVCEGLAYASRAGLDLATVLKSIGGGAAASAQLAVFGPRIIGGDFAPGFFIEHFVKDLGIALAEAERGGLDLPGLAQANQLYRQLAEQGHGRSGTQALFTRYES